MIPGSKVLDIEWFAYIDRNAEGLGTIKPKENQKFQGVPNGWYEEKSKPFIEVYTDGKLDMTINCDDVSAIKFKEPNS